ncbi:hypothetical protein EMGBS15_06660 [Filimonas sp.]|nr:hypothetical protein EMGBS15_06660 [Filimonas sp.]
MGNVFRLNLSFENNQGLIYSERLCHGFLTLSESATTFYLVSGEYNQQADDGVRFDSIAFNWPVKQAIVSERDRLLPASTNFILILN